MRIQYWIIVATKCTNSDTSFPQIDFEATRGVAIAILIGNQHVKVDSIPISGGTRYVKQINSPIGLFAKSLINVVAVDAEAATRVANCCEGINERPGRSLRYLTLASERLVFLVVFLAIVHYFVRSIYQSALIITAFRAQWKCYI